MSDHFPIMIKLDINKKAKITSKLKIIFCRDIDRIVTSELKDALEEQDWFNFGFIPIYFQVTDFWFKFKHPMT